MLKKLKQFNLPEIEEKVLKFWKENDVFKKSLKNREGQKPFRFFEGPPTANGRPGMHHVLGRAFKDIILRYKTMRGYYVPRRAGWDTHGLPVEIEVEKELGIKNKGEIEKFGIAEFNARAKASVWRYKSDWEKLTERVGFWLDFDNPYITYDKNYIESLWQVFARIAEKGFLKKLHKIVPWCPRCQTPLSSHELGQPGAYKKTKDPSVYVKFALQKKEYLLVWTTTPWTLSANVAIAINPKLTYTKYKIGDEYLWSHNPPPSSLVGGKSMEVEVVEKISGKKLVGLKYRPLFDLPKSYKLNTENYYKVLGADFISTEEGTGLVHIAPAFGEDDLKLWRDENFGLNDIPTTVDDAGIVKSGFPGAGKFIKEADKDIIVDLAKRDLIYFAGIIEHEYPFCWRCSNPLIYFARFSWFIEMSKLRDKLLAANQKINWIPENVKEGRFGEWLKEVKDWAISRNRYWGTPLPIWECAKCENYFVAGSLQDLNKYSFAPNKFFIARHGEADHNINGHIAAGPEKGRPIAKLTKEGIRQIEKTAQELKKEKIDIIYCSPYTRTKQTAKIIAKATGAKVIVEKQLGEINTGVFNGRLVSEYEKFFEKPIDKFFKSPLGGESLSEVKKRMLSISKVINKNHVNKNILIVSHGDPLWMLEGVLKGFSNNEILDFPILKVGEWRKLEFNNWPYNQDGKIDLHRPFVDEIYLRCSFCEKGKMERVKEVADVWFDSGAMPFAQWHYPFENKEMIDKQLQFPADYISEGMDQTRGWFYTLLAVSTLLDYEVPYKNVISLGLLLDKHGQKMSKSKGNVVDPFEMANKYGADVMRWFFYTINAPGETKKFDEEELKKVLRKLILIIYNSYSFWNGYADKKVQKIKESSVLDNWITTRMGQLISEVTANLDKYDVEKSGRLIELFVDDLSRWYIRRSRGIFQDVARGNVSLKKSWQSASATLASVLRDLSKIMAPFIPFFSEALYQSLDGGKKSVHLEDWPVVDKKAIDEDLLNQMAEIRRLAALALAEREKSEIKVKQPLARLKVKSLKLKDKRELLELLKDEINVKKIVFDNKISGDVELDTKITPELREEGLARELARMIQGLRQDAGYEMKDRICLMLELPKELSDIVQRRVEELSKTVNVKSIEFKKSVKFDAEFNTKIETLPIWLGVRKI